MVGALSQIHASPMAMVSRTVLHGNLHRQSSSSTSIIPKLMPCMATTPAAPQSYRISVQADIVAHLKQAIPLNEPLRDIETMHHLAFAAPQTTAPALCIAACELIGGHCSEEAMVAASALHLVHAASFSHEELFLADKPEKTVDGLFPYGLQLLAKLSDPALENSERILRVIIEIARATGTQGTIQGRYLRGVWSKSKGAERGHVEGIKEMVRKFEGELHACGAACGAILGGGNEDDIEKLRKYGLYVGMIQGIMQVNVETSDERLMEEVEVLRNLALKELEEFNGSIHEISAFANL